MKLLSLVIMFYSSCLVFVPVKPTPDPADQAELSCKDFCDIVCAHKNISCKSSLQYRNDFTYFCVCESTIDKSFTGSIVMSKLGTLYK
jgi:hypothetical protein